MNYQQLIPISNVGNVFLCTASNVNAIKRRIQDMRSNIYSNTNAPFTHISPAATLQLSGQFNQLHSSGNSHTMQLISSLDGTFSVSYTLPPTSMLSASTAVAQPSNSSAVSSEYGNSNSQASSQFQSASITLESLMSSSSDSSSSSSPMTSQSSPMTSGPKLEIRLLAIDDVTSYIPFASDFGPYNISQMVEFSRILHLEVSSLESDRASDAAVHALMTPTKTSSPYRAPPSYPEMAASPVITDVSSVSSMQDRIALSSEDNESLPSSVGTGSYALSSLRSSPSSTNRSNICMQKLIRDASSPRSVNLKNVNRSCRGILIVCREDIYSRLNAAALLGLYMMAHQKYSALQAYALLEDFVKTYLVRFRDSAPGSQHLDISLLDVFQAVETCRSRGVFSFSRFSISRYMYYASPDHGNLHIILPGKLIAFPSPIDPAYSPDCVGHPPGAFQEIFSSLNVTDVIRLSEVEYDRDDIVKMGIMHHELHIHDGCPPSLQVVGRFLDVVENAKGTVAVHCHAGLGRTGTMIAIYLMKRYGLPAAQACSWVRLCRPGSIVYNQYEYLQMLCPMVTRERDIESHFS